MRYIVPTEITDAMFVSSSVPENDHAAWSAVTAYVLGDRVIRTATHSIYERLAPGTTATAPEADTVNWARVGPTNRWAMLDGAVGTVTDATDSISVVLQPGVVRGLALLDLDVDGITVTMTVGGDVVYTRTINPIASQEDCDNYFDYFFSAIERQRVVIFSDLPPYGDCELAIVATGAGTVSIGSCVLGAMYELGTALAGATTGIIDYSRKMVDDFGVVTVAERSYSKRMSLPLMLSTRAVDVAALRLAKVRAKPVVWIGSESIDSLVVYGFIKDWSVDIPGLTISTCTLEIEGLV